MAVFKLNICKFNNCELIFNNLENLIKHIETNHINYDPKIIEQFETQPPTCLPLFFFSDIPPSSEEKSKVENSKLKHSLSSAKSGTQQMNNSCYEKNTTGQSEVQNNSQDLTNEEKSNNWVAVKANSRAVKNVKVKKTYKCSCGKSYGTSPSLRKHATQCRNAAVITAQVKGILQQKGAESSTNMNNDNYDNNIDDNNSTQQYSSPISLKHISAASGTSLKTLVVSKKPIAKTVNGVSQTVQQPQRVMIQLAELNTVTV